MNGPTNSITSSLADRGETPELSGDTWFNTDAPLRLTDLRGQVVLLEMWTFGCINCRNTIPTLNKWYESYASQGLVIIGNHFPEFSYERDAGNLQQAINDLGIHYPVVMDNDGVNWRAYANKYWPTLYLIDKQGHLRFSHIGEGGYTYMESAIQDLLAEPGS